MNAYFVFIPEVRADTPSVCDLEPPEPWWPNGLFAAETPAQAKHDALRAWSRSSRSGVFSDDWKSLRVRLVQRNVPLERGEVGFPPESSGEPRRLYERLWWRVGEFYGEIRVAA